MASPHGINTPETKHEFSIEVLLKEPFKETKKLSESCHKSQESMNGDLLINTEKQHAKIQNKHPRNYFTEPPSIECCVRENQGLPPHPRANQYPAHFCKAMVAYCEDPYWTERTVPLPPGLVVPRRPLDYYNIIPNLSPPPEDFNWIPPNEPPPIEIPKEAYELFYERRKIYFENLHKNRKTESAKIRKQGDGPSLQ
ncbi:MX region of TRA-2 Related [Caenorhabditis elegans]|uniref:MX region of TRA-2 Related n=1 Tax=Caenorhabditis elegans TaxID=6239 RepID=Q20791_CAEEL|nr:MX region of TRA-2 Related [Caenorhabditis elegans]CAA91757.2 MX region of TRA-2 Related [Caenorhabditis elegans]|eukprot:NP_001309443.1 MX region of TRA-2 Related [Caenorhabditis elegans]